MHKMKIKSRKEYNRAIVQRLQQRKRHTTVLNLMQFLHLHTCVVLFSIIS